MELFRQAVIIMALGMGLTFLFLFCVIQAVRLTGWLVARYEARLAGGAADMDADMGASVAAIVAALHERDAQRGAGG